LFFLASVREVEQRPAGNSGEELPLLPLLAELGAGHGEGPCRCPGGRWVAPVPGYVSLRRVPEPRAFSPVAGFVCRWVRWLGVLRV
jgi:hypothetical protein